MNKIDVSIVIVCMNNYGQLKDCLNSIQQYTTKCTYELLLVAYFFNEVNLAKLKAEFPWVKVIISDEIRGFSANNNLALRQAQGEYCFVLNDDTYMKMPVIDMLVDDMKKHPEAAIVSPQIRRKDDSIQYSGKRPYKWYEHLLFYFHLSDFRGDPTGKYVKESGFFQTYHVLGAAFLIRTSVFKKIGFLDERYFFGPEDLAVGKELDKIGEKVFVDADIHITHLVGSTGSKPSRTMCATRPAERKGMTIFASNGNRFRRFLLESGIFINSFIMMLFFLIQMLRGKEGSRYSFKANKNVCKTIFSNKTTTQIFKEFYETA